VFLFVFLQRSSSAYFLVKAHTVAWFLCMVVKPSNERFAMPRLWAFVHGPFVVVRPFNVGECLFWLTLVPGHWRAAAAGAIHTRRRRCRRRRVPPVPPPVPRLLLRGPGPCRCRGTAVQVETMQFMLKASGTIRLKLYFCICLFT